MNYTKTIAVPHRFVPFRTDLLKKIPFMLDLYAEPGDSNHWKGGSGYPFGLKMKHKRNTGVIILVASLLFVVIFMELWMVFSQTRQQTKDSGSYQLGMISGDLEATVKNAESLTMEIAIAAREYIYNSEALTRFIKKKKKEVIEGETGAFNVFIAGKDYAIIPDFDMPKDFVATEREEADLIRDAYPGFAAEYQKMVQAIAEITETE